MNIAFFLTPKTETVWLLTDSSVHQAIRRMTQSSCSALPILDGRGLYVSTITEGDLLRELVRARGERLGDIERMKVATVPVLRQVRAVGIEAEVEELFARALDQNFVPVVDSRDVFIGIVRRSAILAYCAARLGVTPM